MFASENIAEMLPNGDIQIVESTIWLNLLPHGRIKGTRGPVYAYVQHYEYCS